MGSCSSTVPEVGRPTAEGALDLVRHADTGSVEPKSRRRSEPTGRCPACGRGTYGGATHCKCRRCPDYAPIWARDQQRKCFENLSAYDDGDSTAVMFTLTGPGKEELPWDESRCVEPGNHKCDGRLGCKVHEDVARAWNASASERARRLFDRSARLTARETGVRPHMLLRGWEQQSRGVLHAHVVIGRGRMVDKRVSDVYGRHLARLASSYGFGRVDEPTGRARAARESAAYVASYLSTGKGHKRKLGETVLSDQLPRSVIHVSTDLTMRTCVTMRALRLRRLVWWRWRVVLPFEQQRGLEDLLSAFPGAELVAVDAPRGPP